VAEGVTLRGAGPLTPTLSPEGRGSWWRRRGDPPGSRAPHPDPLPEGEKELVAAEGVTVRGAPHSDPLPEGERELVAPEDVTLRGAGPLTPTLSPKGTGSWWRRRR